MASLHDFDSSLLETHLECLTLPGLLNENE